MTPRNYFALASSPTGPVKYLCENLKAGACFIIDSGVYAKFDGSILFTPHDKKEQRLYKVWDGHWPREEATIEQAIAMIERRRRRNGNPKRFPVERDKVLT